MAGIVVIVIGVALVSLFPPESENAEQMATSVSDSKRQMTLVVLWGITGALFISLETMCVKWLMIKRGINGDVSGMFFLLVEGVLGIACLIVTTLQGSGLHELSNKALLMVLIAGFFAFSALIIFNYSLSKGLAGVAISIFNTSPAI